LSYLANTQTDKQTDRQTNEVWQKHNLLDGGKYQQDLLWLFSGSNVKMHIKAHISRYFDNVPNGNIVCKTDY